MTIINRALHKAYIRRSEAQSALAREERAAAIGGWASKLRQPKRPLAAASQTAAKETGDHETTSLPAAAGRKADGPVVAPTGTKVRVDTPHAPAKGPLVVEKPAATSAAATLPSEAVETAPEQKIEFWAWPPIVPKLLNCPAGAEIQQLAGRLRDLARVRGFGCLAFSGAGRLAGRTSLVLTLAKALTDAGSARVAVIDADFEHPDLARMLSLRPHSGLWDIACERKPASSPWTTLIPGKLAVVPLVARVSPEAVDRAKITALQNFLRAAKREYELVLVDAGPWEALVPPLVFENRVIDAFIGVSRYNDGEERLDDDACRQHGIEWLGTIETFFPASELELQTV